MLSKEGIPGPTKPVFLPWEWAALLHSLWPRSWGLGPGGRTGLPPSIRSPSSRWQDFGLGSFQSHQGASTLFKNFNQQLPAWRTARLGPAGWKPMTVHPQRA